MVKRVHFIVENQEEIPKEDIEKMRKLILNTLIKEFPSYDWEGKD